MRDFELKLVDRTAPESAMRTDALENLFLEEIDDVRRVEEQILVALTGMAKGVPAKRIWLALTQLVETTKQHGERLDRIFHEMEPVHDGETIFCPSVAERMRRELERATSRGRKSLPPSFARLTSREVEVLRFIAEGQLNKQIAAELGISIKTVEKHRQNLMQKVGLHDTASVTRYAISAGVVAVSA